MPGLTRARSRTKTRRLALGRQLEIFAWFESTAFSIWVREEEWVFPVLLVAHALGMGIVVGANVVLAWRLFSRRDQHHDLARLTPLVWAAFMASLISGLLLLAGYPAKALTNPVFYLKLGLVVLGLVFFLREQPRASQPTTRSPARRAVVLLFAWFAAVTAGRLLAYTHSVLLASQVSP
jgi:hypothetical protein